MVSVFLSAAVITGGPGDRDEGTEAGAVFTLQGTGPVRVPSEHRSPHTPDVFFPGATCEAGPPRGLASAP